MSHRPDPTLAGAGPTPARRWRHAGTVVALTALVGLAACSSDEPAATTGEPPATTAMTGGDDATNGTSPAADQVPGGVTTTWDVSLTSEQTQLHAVGAREELTYGWNQLVGTTTIEDLPAEVELLGSVDYLDGSGPWWGFLTVTTDEGELAFRADGQASLDPATADTSFTASLEVIGGTGRYAGAAGGGEVEGTRRDELGGQVDFSITMTLANATE